LEETNERKIYGVNAPVRGRGLSSAVYFTGKTGASKHDGQHGVWEKCGGHCVTNIPSRNSGQAGVRPVVMNLSISRREKMEKEFKITEAENIANISAVLLEMDAFVKKMGGEITAPVTVPAMVDPGASFVEVTLVFNTKALHEYASQSHAQAGKAATPDSIAKDCEAAMEQFS
jgi:hypothetical protein